MKWTDLAEQQIAKATREGQFDNLPGEGRPLKRETSNGLADAGYKIMAREGVVPREIELKKALDAQRAKVAQAVLEADRKTELRKLADLELRLAIEQEARRKYFNIQ